MTLDRITDLDVCFAVSVEASVTNGREGEGKEWWEREERGIREKGKEGTGKGEGKVIQLGRGRMKGRLKVKRRKPGKGKIRE